MAFWKAFCEGTARVWSHRKLLIWLYLFNVAFAIVLVVPFREAVSKISRSDLSEDFVNGFHLNAFIDFWAKHSTEFQSIGKSAMLLGGLYALIYVFLTGGIVETLTSKGPTNLRRFSMAAGRYFWRYLRLLLLLLAVIGGFMAANNTWAEPYVEQQKKIVTTDRASFLWWAGNVGVVLVIVALVFMVFDYAKIRTVVQKRRSMVGATFSALGFVLRRPIRTVSLFSWNLFLLGLLFALYLFIENLFSNATYTSMFALLAVQQLLVLARIWMKLTFFASQIVLYENAVDERVQKPSAPPVTNVPDSTLPSARATL